LKSRPYLANWALIRDAEINFVNTQIKRKSNEGNINGIAPLEVSVHTMLPQTHLTTYKKLDGEAEDDNEKKADMIKNMKTEMSSSPFMATWAQINDAEHRFVSTNKGQPTRGQVARLKSTENKVSLLIKSSLMYKRGKLSYSGVHPK
jgi:hypothetical protein